MFFVTYLWHILTNLCPVVIASWDAGFYQLDRYAIKDFLDSFVLTKEPK